MEQELNWLGLILAAITPMVIGMIYYSKPLFMKPWMAAIGMTEEKQKQGNMPVIFGLSFVSAFAIAFFLIQFNNSYGQEGEFDSFAHGAAHGLILTLFLIAPIFISRGLFAQEGWKLILMNIGYWAITLALMGGIVDYFHQWPNVPG